jgi:hypothetical protein
MVLYCSSNGQLWIFFAPPPELGESFLFKLYPTLLSVIQTVVRGKIAILLDGSPSALIAPTTPMALTYSPKDAAFALLLYLCKR